MRVIKNIMSSSVARDLLALENKLNNNLMEHKRDHSAPLTLMTRMRNSILPFTSSIRQSISQRTSNTLQDHFDAMNRIHNQTSESYRPSVPRETRPIFRTVQPLNPPIVQQHVNRMNQFMTNIMNHTMQSVQSMQIRPLRPGRTLIPQPPEQKTAYLKTLVFKKNEDSTQPNQDADAAICGICHGEFKEEEHIVNTTCCGTKFMHINCSIHCLRHSETCPFCRSAKIAFFDRPEETIM